jgi:FMN phosphatase YigB (HAD superfamily)
MRDAKEARRAGSASLLPGLSCSVRPPARTAGKGFQAKMNRAFDRVMAESGKSSALPVRPLAPSDRPWDFTVAQSSARAILLDLCGVLIDDTLWSRWLFQLVSRIGLHSHFDLFWRVWQQDYQQPVNHGRCDYWDALRSFLAASGLTRGQIDEVCHAAIARRRQLDESVRPFPGVKSTLHKLQSRGWKLGVIANSPRTTGEVRHRLETMGIATPFDLVVSSRDLAQLSPSTCRYRQTTEAWQLPGEQIVFVSTRGYELEAASQAGMLPIAMPRPADCSSELAIEHLDELVQFVPGEQVWARAG